MSKKSFFEKLTGATKDDLFNEEFMEKDYSTKKVTLSDSKAKRPSSKPSPKGATKKEEESKTAEEVIKAEETKQTEWLPEEEGQLTIDVYQTDNDVVIKSTIAGVKSNDIDVEITNDMITIRGMRKNDENVPQENYYYQELYWGPFSRSVILPIDIDADKAKASMKNGIITIKLPKLEKLKTKTLKVKELE